MTMTGAEMGEQQSGSTLICLVPPELSGKLVDYLRDHYRRAGVEVEVLVEQRSRERRSGTERRKKDKGPPGGGEDRRHIRSVTGRRMGERRAKLVPAVDPPPLPRRAQRYAEQLTFVERIETPAQEVEDRETSRLVARFQAGQREAFTALYSLYFDRVYGYLRVMLRDQHQAEDTTQQVFMQLFERLDKYEYRGQPFRGWLFTLVRNLGIDHLRKHQGLAVEEPEEVNRRRDRAAAEHSNPEMLRWISDRDLQLFVDRLPLAQRQVLLLRFMMDMPTSQIAQVLGRSEEDVRALQSRALRFLNERLSAVRAAPKRAPRSRSRRCAPQAPVLRMRRWALVK